MVWDYAVSSVWVLWNYGVNTFLFVGQGLCAKEKVAFLGTFCDIFFLKKILQHLPSIKPIIDIYFLNYGLIKIKK